MNTGPPQWVIQQLIDDGKLTRDRVTARPVPRRCPRCKQRVTSALIDGTRADMHPAALTALGELQALMADRLTYEVTEQYGKWRDPITIRMSPTEERIIYHDHNCTQLHPFDYRVIPGTVNRDRPGPDTPPPF